MRSIRERRGPSAFGSSSGQCGSDKNENISSNGGTPNLTASDAEIICIVSSYPSSCAEQSGTSATPSDSRSTESACSAMNTVVSERCASLSAVNSAAAAGESNDTMRFLTSAATTGSDSAAGSASITCSCPHTRCHAADQYFFCSAR